MFESYMHKQDGSWDFSLFDRAFKMAEKYDIKVMGTFFPATDKTDIGGWKFPKDNEQLNSFSEYIKQLVLHFKQFKSLYAWVLINEPGGGLQNNEFAREMRLEWNKQNPQPEYLPNGYPVLVDLQEYRFKRYMTSWMLKWIAEEVRKSDQNVNLHVNNHAIFSNFQEYDFPYWRTFLTSLGGSAHASWHFGQFKRDEYALAMSANSEILLSGAGNLPWFMTELQGGNNTFSGMNAMCPTKEEIIQWLWTVIGSEGKGGIFWSLNPRASGIESGEWALLDFQNQPTDRVQAISELSHCINENAKLFGSLKKVETGVNLLYIRESQWTEDIITGGLKAATDGRKTELSDLLGYFQSFSEMGITPNIKAWEEFDFNKNDYRGTIIILANQIAIPNAYTSVLENFVSKGGQLIADGLTGYYDENVHNSMLTGFSLKKLFGGEISEYCFIDSVKQFSLVGCNESVPGYGWKGFIKPMPQSLILSKEGDKILASSAKFGKGEVIWVPSLLGTAARKEGSKPLSTWLMKVCKVQVPFQFSAFQKGLLMKTLKSDDGYLTIIVNKSKEKKVLVITKQDSKLISSLLFANFGGAVSGSQLTIHPEETIVVYWK